MSPRFHFLLIVALCIGLSGAGPSRAEEGLLVRWVDDGDTIVLADGRRIRYIGINAPEIGHREKKPERLGPEAKDANRRMVFQTRVRLELDEEKSDQYGRLLAYIFGRDKRFINREMLLQGWAYYLYRFPNIRYHDTLLAAQQTAMKEGRGIWHNWSKKRKSFIGNKASRRFHLESCPLAQEISLQKRVYFTEKWEALWQGYAPGKSCLPGGLSD